MAEEKANQKEKMSDQESQQHAGERELTIFERILAKEISADIVYEDEDVLAFRDVAPQTPVHILVIPKPSGATRLRDFSDLVHCDPLVVGRLFSKAALVAKQMGLKDYRVISNCGAGAGQSVFYLHIHILSGRPLAWPPG